MNQISGQSVCFTVPLMDIKVGLFPLKTHIHTQRVTECTPLEMTLTKEHHRNVHTPSYLSIFRQTHTADKDTQVVQTKQVRKSIFKSIIELEKNNTKSFKHSTSQQSEKYYYRSSFLFSIALDQMCVEPSWSRELIFPLLTRH